MPPKKMKRDLGHWLWLSTDGEVCARRHMPNPVGAWLGFMPAPPLRPFTEEEARYAVIGLCDFRDGRYYFRSDPKTQGHLRELFRNAVQAEAAKRPT